MNQGVSKVEVFSILWQDKLFCGFFYEWKNSQFNLRIEYNFFPYKKT